LFIMVPTEGHSLCKHCLHDLQFDISCHSLSVYENKILVQNCLLNEWTLAYSFFVIQVEWKLWGTEELNPKHSI
jgi:hypothetical protein